MAGADAEGPSSFAIDENQVLRRVVLDVSLETESSRSDRGGGVAEGSIDVAIAGADCTETSSDTGPVGVK